MPAQPRPTIMTHVRKVAIVVVRATSGLDRLIVHLYLDCGTRRQFAFWTREGAQTEGAQSAARFALNVARERTLERYEHDGLAIRPWDPSSTVCFHGFHGETRWIDLVD